MTYIAIRDYKFDLQGEIDAAFVLFPQLVDSVFFVEAWSNSGRKGMALICRGPAWEKHKNDPARIERVRASVLKTVSTQQSRAVHPVAFPDMRYIVINMARRNRSAFDHAFCFDHELGHQLVPSGGLGDKDEDVLRGESAADAFGALRCMQRFGPVQGVRLMSQRAAERALAVVKGGAHYTGDWEHLTTQVLAQIVKDQPVSEFEKLTPPETIEMAEYFAQHYAPTDAQAKALWRRSRDLLDFSTGAGTEENHHEDVARRCDAETKLEVGVRFFYGRIVKKDEAKAFYWFSQAAQRQYPEAQAWMGYCYRNGVGVGRNFPEAFRWYQLSGDQGCKFGLRGVAECYERGEGVTRNDATAVEWYRRAADAGDGCSQYSLFEAYDAGRGIPADKAEAQRWLAKSAETGYNFAQLKMGEAAADPAERRKWYAKAAQGGDAEAKRRLNAMENPPVPASKETA